MHNPTGYIALCVAENKLVTSILVDRCMQSGTASAALSDPQVYCYNSFLGMPVAREAAAYFLARWFLFPPHQDEAVEPAISRLSPIEALQHIQPSHIALAAGASAILNNLFFVLGDVGDACLIPAPYYAAFENDMNLVSHIVPFAIHQANPMQGPTESELSLAYLQCKSTGLNPRFLLLTNPHNPLGIIYRPAILQRSVTWARKRKMHTIVDEIYALSTHQV
jgi:histidinol-phosphate/aromatic aminotransferase/cobyric acid decarboxylase-like protein